MQEDLEKATEERLKARLADTLFGELDQLTALKKDVREKIDRLAAEVSGIEKQERRIIKMIKDAGLRRTGSASEDGSADEEPATVDRASLPSSEDGKTHKQMILEIVKEAGEVGVRPVEIGNEIKRRYGKDITSGLHTQIARLSKEGKIRRQGEGWKLSQKNAG